MSAVHLVFLLVSLLPFSTAAPAPSPSPDECSQLNQTLTREELDKILGKWIAIEAVSDRINFGSVLERLGSYVIVVNTTRDNNTLVFDQATPMPRKDKKQDLMMDGGCGKSTDNVTFVSDKFLVVYMDPPSRYHRFLRTSQNCMLMYTDTRVVDYQALFFFGRNKTVQASDLETFRKQAACLHFPLPAQFHYDPSSEPCPV